MKCNYIYWKEMRIESLHPLKGGIGFKTSVIPVRLPKGNTRKHWLCAITSTHKHLKPELNTNRTQIIKNRKNIELHAPVQPKSLSWWEEVGNSLIFQHIAASLDTPWLPTALLPGHYIDTAFGLQLLVHTHACMVCWPGQELLWLPVAVMWLLIQHTHATTSHSMTSTELQHPLWHLVALITTIVSVASGGPLGH